MDIEVLALVVRLVLDVPYPAVVVVAFFAPEIEVFGVGWDEVGFRPQLGDVGLAASTDCAAVGFA